MFKQIYGNKYHNQRYEYNGINYHSKKEAGYAMELDLRKKAKKSEPLAIKDWDRQKKIEINIYYPKKGKCVITDIPATELKNQGKEFVHICNYYIDFIIYHYDGEQEYIEVKGMETDTWRLKWKLTEAIFKDDSIRTLTLIK